MVFNIIVIPIWVFFSNTRSSVLGDRAWSLGYRLLSAGISQNWTLAVQEAMRTVYDPQYIEFIARLRNARKANNYTQADLAELLNKPQSFVAKVETCERRIDVIEAVRWCAVLGVSLQDLIPAVPSKIKARKR